MCDINCIWLFNILVAAVLLILQQQHVVGENVHIERQHQQDLQQHNYRSPYDSISSYGVAAARKYLSHTSSHPHPVAKRETNNGKNTDFISYMNDFNIQDETSIPEDIIDQQHLQENIDKKQEPQQTFSQNYAGESATVTSVLNGDDDVIDVNLPFDDSADTDSDVDIILESQRSSERSDDNKQYNNNSKYKNNKQGSEKAEMLLEKRNGVKKNKIFLKKIYIEKEILKDETPLNRNSDDNKATEKKPAPVKFENDNDYSNQYNSFGDEDKKYLTDPADDAEGDEDKYEMDADDDDGSAEYERFKTMHEQKQKQKELQKQIEQISTQKPTLDEEPFNTQYSSEEVVKHMVDYPDDNNDKNKNINDYEIFHKHLLEQRKKLLQQQNHPQQPKQDAIGDIENNEDTKFVKDTVGHNKMGRENQNNFPNIFIPRKIKRHNAAARLGDASNRFTRTNQEVEEQQQIKSSLNTEENRAEAVAKVSSQEENFKKKYYDILKENSTLQADHPIQQRQHPSGELNTKDLNSLTKDDERAPEVVQQTEFEKEKSQRRSNKRYGHKTHKKKYKDYLRYSQLMAMSTTNSTPLHEQNMTSNALNMAAENQEHTAVSEDNVADSKSLRKKHAKKLKLEEIKSVIPQAPIFVLRARKDQEKSENVKETAEKEESTAKPFYEGQINYFLETPDDDSERANEVRFITKGERMEANDWYTKLSPVLRNGKTKVAAAAEERSRVEVGRSRGGYSPYHHYRPQHQSKQHHGQTRNHRYHQQHQHQHQHQYQQQHRRQFNKHSRHHAYQRKMLPKRILVTTTPLPPPSHQQLINSNGIGEIGHQITEIKDLDRYYAKWPHLARVQSKLHEEQMREQQMENYPDYEYDNDDYVEENEHKVDNLPPYIRKFNRRNKQLLDLLEGTISPPAKLSQQLRWSGSKLQPGPKDSSVGSMSVHIDDDYLKEKRKRYHQRQRQIQDLFAQQKTSTTTRATPSYAFASEKQNKDEQFSHTENHLPDEDISISLESTEHENEPLSSKSERHEGSNDEDVSDDEANDDSQPAQEIWQKEIKSKFNGNLQKTNWQTEKLTTSTPVATYGTEVTATKKSAIHKLPSYPSIAGGFMNRPRSRSSQFAPSSGSEFRRESTSYLNNLNSNNDNNNFFNAGGFVAYNKAPVASKTINGRFSANAPNDFNIQQHQSVLNTTTTSPDTAKMQSSGSDNSPSVSPSSVTNSFIYHRVVDASPRFVGAGFIAGRKQRLPFVAITDRRLETSKKSLTDHPKDFEQNHYPLP